MNNIKITPNPLKGAMGRILESRGIKSPSGDLEVVIILQQFYLQSLHFHL